MNSVRTLSTRLPNTIQLPTPRCKAYEKLGIAKEEGAKLAQILGFGSQSPFTPDQFQQLSDVCDRLDLWRRAGLKFPKFCEQLEKENEDSR